MVVYFIVKKGKSHMLENRTGRKWGVSGVFKTYFGAHNHLYHMNEYGKNIRFEIASTEIEILDRLYLP